VTDSVVGSPAFNAGISSGMRVIGVNDRVFSTDVLEDTIQATAKGSSLLNLLVVSNDYYRTAAVNYHGGDRFPHLVRNEKKPDYIDELAKPRVSKN
jgi:predicted metalloprotease with PDZ domain